MFDYSALRGAMRAKNVTQEQLAARIGISTTSLINKLKGANPYFKADEIILIKEALELPGIEEFFFVPSDLRKTQV